MYAGNYRSPIDPFQYSHRCDNSASYVPKQRNTKKQSWQKVTDSTGRGYNPSNPVEGKSGCVSNQQTKSLLPKPSMQSILTQEAPSLDRQNRFFEDNRKRLCALLTYELTQKDPKYASKKEIAPKITSNPFVEVKAKKEKVPRGFVKPDPEATYLEGRPLTAISDIQIRKQQLKQAIKAKAPTRPRTSQRKTQAKKEQVVEEVQTPSSTATEQETPKETSGQNTTTIQQPAAPAQTIIVQCCGGQQNQQQSASKKDSEVQVDVVEVSIPTVPKIVLNQQTPAKFEPVQHGQSTACLETAATESKQTTLEVEQLKQSEEQPVVNNESQDEIREEEEEQEETEDKKEKCAKKEEDSEEQKEDPKIVYKRKQFSEKDPCWQRTTFSNEKFMGYSSEKEHYTTNYRNSYSSAKKVRQGRVAGVKIYRDPKFTL